jgi:DNA polymerase
MKQSMKSLKELRASINSCEACYLKEMPHVLWRGNIHAPLMVVGEAPGKWEHKENKPWVGPAGIELDKAFAVLGLDTNKHCFITNVVKARPIATTRGKENDTPRVQAIRTCSSLWIKQEIALLEPKVILCMGRSAAIGLGIIKSSVSMRTANGMEVWYDESRSSRVLITYHTASVLHMDSDSRYTNADIAERKREILNVLKRAKELAYPST